MSERRLTLRLMPERFAICRFGADDALPAWVLHREARLWSMTRTPSELSVVCAEDDLPPSVERAERGWRAFVVDGPLPFGLTGIVSGLTAPLAEAGIPVFMISTYDTDIVLVRGADVEQARRTLARANDVLDAG